MAQLQTRVCGIDFPNPVWTAAGPTGASGRLLRLAADAGAGGLVAKTISVHPARVPIPNIAAPFPGSLLNAELWSEINYQRFLDVDFPEARAIGVPVIASLGYSPQELSVLGAAIEGSNSVDAIEFSIHYVGKDVDNLVKTATALKSVTDLPVLAKLSPAVSDISEVVNALDAVVDGFVAINSLGPALDFNIETLQPVLGSEDGRGWLSGRAILPVGLHFVATIASLTHKPVIGVGGIRAAEDVIKYIMAGASAVQVCSTAILQGEKVYAALTKKLAAWMDSHGYETVDRAARGFQDRKRT